MLDHGDTGPTEADSESVVVVRARRLPSVALSATLGVYVAAVLATGWTFEIALGYPAILLAAFVLAPPAVDAIEVSSSTISFRSSETTISVSRAGIEFVELAGWQIAGLAFPAGALDRHAPFLRLVGRDGRVLFQSRIGWIPMKRLQAAVGANEVGPSARPWAVELAPAPPPATLIGSSGGVDQLAMSRLLEQTIGRVRRVRRNSWLAVGSLVILWVVWCCVVVWGIGWTGFFGRFAAMFGWIPLLWLFQSVRDVIGWPDPTHRSIEALSLAQACEWERREVVVLPGTTRGRWNGSIGLLDTQGEIESVLPVCGRLSPGWPIGMTREWVWCCEVGQLNARRVVIADLSLDRVAECRGWDRGIDWHWYLRTFRPPPSFLPPPPSPSMVRTGSQPT